MAAGWMIPTYGDSDMGEMVPLLGSSGCGKTTTLFAVSGIHQVTLGRILFSDHEVHRLPPQERHVGIVFQSYALYPHLNVYENIAFPLRVRKESKSEIDSKIRKMAAILRIPICCGVARQNFPAVSNSG